MNSDTPSGRPPAAPFAAVCGLFCPACTLYIATTEDPARLGKLAAMFGHTEEEMKCLGCRSQVRGPYCRVCRMVTCAAERGVDFCAECADYPCEVLKEFQAARPHRLDLFEDGKLIREKGFATWFGDTFARYSCEECRTLNSAYDLVCRRCGHDPGSPFVRRHREAIARHVAAAPVRNEEGPGE